MAKNCKISNLKANLCIRLFLLVSFQVIFRPLQAQDATQLSSAYRHFLNFELDSCTTALEQNKITPLGFYLKSLLASATVFVNDDADQYAAKKSLESDLLDELSEQSFSTAYSNFLRSEIKLQWAILKFKNGDEFSAFWSLKQAYAIAESNVKKYPQFIPSYKTLGLLHVLYGSFPDKYDWILSLFGLEDDVEKGLGELELAAKGDRYLSIEINVMRGLIYTYLLNDPAMGSSIIRSVYEQGSYLLVDYAYALVLMKNSESDIALDIIEKVDATYPQPFKISQIYYAYGEILLQKGLHYDAIDKYRQFLSIKTRGNLVKDAYYKIGIGYLMENNTDSASYNFEASVLNGLAKNEADKNARIAVESGIIPNKNLLQLRYATDGGFYEAAFDIYSQMKPELLNTQDKCEYLYRSARLFHKTGEVEKALQYYQKTIDHQQEENWYFAPNASLQSALIFIDQNKLEMAKKYLNQVNNYKGYPYQNSIRQKARAASRQIN